MSTARGPVVGRVTGLPPGVDLGSLGRRVLAYVVDGLIPAIAGGAVAASVAGPYVVRAVVVAVLVSLTWALVCWRQLAVKAATPGMRLAKIQLVGFYDGRPVGWGRVFLRWLLFAALSTTGLGLVLVLISILADVRHQGWHDRAVAGVVIAERPLAPPLSRATTGSEAIESEDAPAGEAVADPQAVPEPEPEPEPMVLVPAPVAAPVAGDPALPPEPVVPAEPAPQPAPTAEAAPVVADEVMEEEKADTVKTVPAHATAAANGSTPSPRGRTILDGWFAELDDGREIQVDGLVLVGRNPQPSPGEQDAQLVKLSDESRTVSKTHLALGVDDAGLFVVDRGSTNGSTVTPPGRPAVPADAYHAMSVAEGSVVSIGDHWLRIHRTAD